ncbi:arsenite methyltransferase isoform X3 [Phalacrocorax carbo]|uniref:arsenite methyltransferase isoform X3 n=1 Tax=Phalacrocorax carbo TaxID=9209 RepID=UPI00311A530D
MAAPCGEQIHREVQDYYGKVLQKSEDLKTNACVTSARPLPKAVRDALERIHEEVVARYYGCGLVIPECLASCQILDLGSGSGRDCYLLSQLVGEQGHVTGIDMTEGQVEVAKKHIAYHMDKFGYQKPNVEFLHGYMEKLGDAGLADESYDIIISNCVINLSPDKRAVLQEVYRVLKGNAWREPCTGEICTASLRRWGSAPHAWSPPAPSPLVTRSWRTLLATAALSLQPSDCSRCRVAAGRGRAKSSTTVGSWDTSESCCLTPTSPSRKERWWMWMPRWPRSCRALGLRRSSSSETVGPTLPHRRAAVARK